MITSITIENFKGIGKPVTIPIRPLAQLFGKNSTGKLNMDQQREVRAVRGVNAGAKVGGALFGAFGTILFVLLTIACFVNGLIGWLLVMKKWVLQCTSCGAVVNAS